MGDVIGVVGLGVMGSAMAGHIVRAGHTVHGFDTDAAKVEAFPGAAASSASDVAERSDVVLLSLPTADALEAVTAEIAGVGRDGLVVVEMGTLALADKLTARERLSGAGVTMLDAPVSGTGLQAADATLVVYCSGPTAAYERVRPIFGLLARQAYDLGEFGNGSRMKFLANLLVTVNTLAAAEVHALGAAAGLDADVVQEVIAAGVGSSRLFEIRGPMMATGIYEPPSARLAIVAKDAAIIAAFARQVGASTPLLDAAIPLYERGMTEGLSDLDAAALRMLL